MLKSLRHDLQAQSRGHHAIDLVEERGVEKRKLWKIFLQRTKGAIVNQTNTDKHGNCFEGNAGEASEKRGGAHMGFSELIYICHLELN